MQRLSLILITAVLLLSALPQTMFAQTAESQTTLIDTFKDWAAYQHDGKASKICFALTKPKTTSPSSLKRNPVFFYVSAWPKDGVKAEISVKMGYTIKKDSVATIKIGSASYRLLTESDKAFVDDPTAELKLIEAMKRGSTMIVEAQSANGASSKDTYSLRGVTKAIKTLVENCS